MVIGQFFPLTGGAERQCQRLSEALLSRGHDVRVLTTRHSRKVPRYEVVGGIAVERLGYPRLGSVAWLIFAARILRLSRRFDVVHVHQGAWPALSAALACWWSEMPTICKIANSGDRFDLRLLRSRACGAWAVRIVKSRMRRFVCTSTAVLRDLENEGITADTIARIPNGIDKRPRRERRMPDAAAPVEVLFVGSLTSKKNVLLIPEALRRLPAAYRDRLRVTIVGEGVERRMLEADIRRLQLDGVVRIVGFVREPDAHFAGADLFLLPSLTEGLSNAALEAMSWGLPLILSDAGGNTDLVHAGLPAADSTHGDFQEGDTGVLIQTARPESLAAALTFMVDHPDKRRSMGERSLERIDAQYSMERVVRQYEDLYDQCCLSRSAN